MSLHKGFWGLRKIIAYSHSSSQCLLVSTVFAMVSSLHPASDFYTCNNNNKHSGMPFPYYGMHISSILFSFEISVISTLISSIYMHVHMYLQHSEYSRSIVLTSLRDRPDLVRPACSSQSVSMICRLQLQSVVSHVMSCRVRHHGHSISKHTDSGVVTLLQPHTPHSKHIPCCPHSIPYAIPSCSHFIPTQGTTMRLVFTTFTCVTVCQ